MALYLTVHSTAYLNIVGLMQLSNYHFEHNIYIDFTVLSGRSLAVLRPSRSIKKIASKFHKTQMLATANFESVIAHTKVHR